MQLTPTAFHTLVAPAIAINNPEQRKSVPITDVAEMKSSENDFACTFLANPITSSVPPSNDSLSRHSSCISLLPPHISSVDGGNVGGWHILSYDISSIDFTHFQTQIGVTTEDIQQEVNEILHLILVLFL